MVQLELKTEIEKNGEQLMLFLRTPNSKFNQAATEANKNQASTESMIIHNYLTEHKAPSHIKKRSDPKAPSHRKKRSGSPPTIGNTGVFSHKRQQQEEKKQKEYRDKKIRELQDSYDKINSKIKEYDDVAERYLDQI